MITEKIKVNIQSGLEARPIAMLVQTASQYNSKIYLEHADKKVNAKSIMGMMTLGIVSGENVVVTVEGDDEAEAMEGIQKFLNAQAVAN
jgi:catabolite repression HPr-like protein